MKKIFLVAKYSLEPNEYTYASSFYRVLVELGYEVIPCNNKKNYLWWPVLYHDELPRFLKPLNTLIVHFYLFFLLWYHRPAVVFFIKAENIFARFIRLIQKMGIKTVLFYPDNPFCLWNGNTTLHVIKALHLHDELLMWEHALIAQLYAIGAKRVTYFPFAHDATIFFPREEQVRYQKKIYDVCFVGTWDAEREQWLTLLKQRMPELKVGIWGNGWQHVALNNDVLRQSLQGVAVYGEEMIQLWYCSSIVLNFVRKQNLEGHNMRTFEILACGAFMLTQRTLDQVRTPFHEDENIVCFATIDELIQKITYYLSFPEQRKKLIEAGVCVAEQNSLKKQLQNIQSKNMGVL